MPNPNLKIRFVGFLIYLEEGRGLQRKEWKSLTSVYKIYSDCRLGIRAQKKKRQRAWTPERFSEIATALRLLPIKALAQNVQDWRF